MQSKRLAVGFRSANSIAVDSGTNLYLSETYNYRIRKITPEGTVTTFGSIDETGGAARFAGPTGVATDIAGNVFVADVTTIRKITSAGVVTTIAGLAGNYGSSDGIGTNASFREPNSLAVDNLGNIYVADTRNETIRKITTARMVTTLAGLAGHFGSAD